MARSTEQVFEDHKNALLTGDFPKLISDYADDAVLVTIDGTFVGKDAIQDAFQNLYASHPNARLAYRKTVVRDDTILAQWSGESDVATIPQGVDTFIIQDDRIQRQTSWFTLVEKST